MCHKTTFKCAKEGVVKFHIVAVSLQYLLPIVFVGKIFYKATSNSYDFSFIYHITISFAYMKIIFATN